MDLYSKTERFIKELSADKGKHSMKHPIRTAFWVKKLYPKAGQSLLIAAIAHDVERAFREDDIGHVRNSKNGFLDEEHLKYHQEKGAEIIFDFLIKEGADEELASEVRSLVEKHESGGTEEQNILKDADSVSFFENNIDHFIKDKAGETGRGKVKEKFIWMFNRITSRSAREIARPWYEEGMKKLGC